MCIDAWTTIFKEATFFSSKNIIIIEMLSHWKKVAFMGGVRIFKIFSNFKESYVNRSYNAKKLEVDPF